MNNEKAQEIKGFTAHTAVKPEELLQFLPTAVALFDIDGQLISYSPTCLEALDASNAIECRDVLQSFFDYSQKTGDPNHVVDSLTQPDADFSKVGSSGATLVSFIARDPITKLLSKSRFVDKIDTDLNQNQFSGATLLCISFNEFDEFKAATGETSGDRLLAKIAERLTSTLPDTCRIARTGNANFSAFMLSSMSTGEACESIDLARQAKEILSRPFLIDGEVAQLQANVGWTSTIDLTKSMELFRRAELSLAINAVCADASDKPYSIEMDHKRIESRKLEFDLRKAILLNQFELHYQMQLDYTSQKITGFEALIRWNHPERGMIFPDVFIPLAEKSGLIVAMGEWVINAACKEAMKWPEDIRVAVNVSPVQLQSKHLISVIENTLRDTGLSPDRLEIEITESTAIQDETNSREVLLALKELGLSIALDDFGTGYASLSYLRSFPFDKLKIDQSFVRSDHNRFQNDLVLQSMFALGKCFGMTTLAEGIETEEHQEKLMNLGCENAQGYLYSRPVPISKTFELLEKFNHVSISPSYDAEEYKVVCARELSSEANLYQIAYISDNAASAGSERLKQVMESIQIESSRNNTADNISGALMFNQHCFAQIIEGESHVIERTFERIQTDPRHQNIQVLDYGRIEERSFPEWAMAFIGENNSNTRHFDQVSLIAGSGVCENRTANLQQIMLDILEKNSVFRKAA